MNLDSTPEDDAFRARVRAWLAENVPKARRPAGGPEMREYDLAWQRKQFEAGFAGISWPRGARWSRAFARPADDLVRGVRERRRAAARRELRRHQPRWPDADCSRERGAEGEASPRDPPRRGGLVPRLLGAGRRFRSRLAAHARRRRWRHAGGDRPEDLDELRRRRRLPGAPRADRSGRAEEAPGDHLGDLRHEVARHHDPADPHDLRNGALRRGLLRRGADPARERRRQDRTTAGAWRCRRSPSSAAPRSWPTR